MAKNILIPFLMLTLSALSAATYTVPGDYAGIQAAIATTIDGDSIIVAPGFYYENIDFLGKAIVITSRFEIENDTLLIDSTVIDGLENGSVCTFKNGEKTIVFCPGLHLKTEMEIMKTRMKMVLISITAEVSIAREVHPLSYIVPYRTITVPAVAVAGFFVLKRRPFFKTALWLTIVRMMWAADCMLATVPALSFFIAGLQEI